MTSKNHFFLAYMQNSLYLCRREMLFTSYSLQEDLSIIQLTSLPFSDFYKPMGELFDLCAEGRLLLLSPLSLSASPDKVKPSAYMPRAQQNPYWQTQRRISRAECVTLNTIAETIAN